MLCDIISNYQGEILPGSDKYLSHVGGGDNNPFESLLGTIFRKFH